MKVLKVRAHPVKGGVSLVQVIILKLNQHHPLEGRQGNIFLLLPTIPCREAHHYVVQGIESEMTFSILIIKRSFQVHHQLDIRTSISPLL